MQPSCRASPVSDTRHKTLTFVALVPHLLLLRRNPPHLPHPSLHCRPSTQTRYRRSVNTLYKQSRAWCTCYMSRPRCPWTTCSCATSSPPPSTTKQKFQSMREVAGELEFLWFYQTDICLIRTSRILYFDSVQFFKIKILKKRLWFSFIGSPALAKLNRKVGSALKLVFE